MAAPRRTIVLSRTTRAPIPFRLRDAAGVPVPLTDATLALVLTPPEAAGTAVVWSSGGVIRHQEQAANPGWAALDPPLDVLRAMLGRYTFVATVTVTSDPTSPRTWSYGDVFMAEDGSPGIYGPTSPVDDFVVDSFGVRGLRGPSALAKIVPWSIGAAYVAGPPASFVSYLGASYECMADHVSSAAAPPSADNPLWGLIAAAAPPVPPAAAIVFALIFG